MAKAQGRYRGGKPKLAEEQVAELRDLVAKGVPKANVAKQFTISRETVYQYLQSGELASYGGAKCN